MAQHHDLELLEFPRSQAQRGDRKHTPKEQVQQRWNQATPPSPGHIKRADSMDAGAAPTHTVFAPQTGLRTPRGRVLGPLPSAPEDRQLVAQHDDLKIPLTTTTGEHAEEAAQEPVQQRHQQDAQSEPARPRPPTRPSRPESNFFTPHALGSRFHDAALSVLLETCRKLR